MPIGNFLKDQLFTKDNTTAANFIVEVNAMTIGRFSEIEGLQMEVEVEEYNEGGVNDGPHRFPTRLVWPNITLKRGITNDNNLFDWFDAVAGQRFANSGLSGNRDSVAITLISTTGKRLRAWTLLKAYPVRWTGPTLSSAEDSIATEQLELAHQGFTSVTLL
jgi:phage tail-like protein